MISFTSKATWLELERKLYIRDMIHIISLKVISPTLTLIHNNNTCFKIHALSSVPSSIKLKLEAVTQSCSVKRCS